MIFRKTIFSTKFLFVFFTVLSLLTFPLRAEEESTDVRSELQKISADLKTLEKAFYKTSEMQTSKISSKNLNEDVLTRHLLKLNEIEEQFQELTNKYEEINFKIDRLSNRITKMQTDNQMRFTDLESSGVSPKSVSKEKKRLPGTDLPQDLGRISDTDLENTNEVQQTQSVETAGLVVTEKKTRKSLLPNKSSKEQYEFAVSFIKIGDYETAELALREFVDNNPKHELAGNAQYWYGETFRVRQLYQDAASAYLDGYQKYPKSNKAPVNLLKLGVMLVQIGEKEQGCSMIIGIKDQYPEASQSVIQKAEYEKKKFNCGKKS